MKLGIHAVTTVLALGALLGCSENRGKETPATGRSGGQPAAAGAAALPADLFASEAIEGAKPVGELKAANPKGEVVLRGRIGGRADAFVNGAAVFLVVDPALKSCADLHEDPGACKTPWDYCCEPQDSLLANIATVQIVDQAGKPLRTAVDGQHGLKPLAEVIVAGEVVPQEDGGPLIVNARRIYVVQ